MATHPVVSQLMPRRDWWRGCVPLWVAFAMCATGVASAVYYPWLPPPFYGGYRVEFETSVTLWILWAVTTPVSLVTAITAVTLTSRSIESGLHETLCTTPLERGSLARAYVRAALHRMRAPLALALGMVGVLAFATHSGQRIAGCGTSGWWWGMGLARALFCPTQAIDSSVPPYAAIAVTAWSASFFAAPVGVALALRWRGRAAPLILAPLLTAAATLLLVLVAAPAVLAISESGRNTWERGTYLFLLLVPPVLGMAWLSPQREFAVVVALLVVGLAAFTLFKPAAHDGYGSSMLSHRRVWESFHSYVLLALYALATGLFLYRQRRPITGSVACAAAGMVTVILPLAVLVAVLAGTLDDDFLSGFLAWGGALSYYVDHVARALIRACQGLGTALAPSVLLAPFALAWAATRLAGRWL